MKRTLVAVAVLGSLTACAAQTLPPPTIPPDEYEASIAADASAAAAAADDASPYVEPPPDPDAGMVTFKITSSVRGATVNFITYSPNGTSMSQVTRVRLPWSKRMEYGSSGIVVLNAQSLSGGATSCEIDADGEEIDKQTAEGQYAMVQCSGTIPGARGY